MAARNLPEMRSPTTGLPFARRGKLLAAAGGGHRVIGREPHWTGAVELIPSKLDEPLRWRKPQRVFVNSMSDLFHESLPNEDIAQVFHVMYGEASASPSPNHTYQILTKRPARMLDWFRWLQAYEGDDPTILALSVYARFQGANRKVWLGVSVEDQATADVRIPLLLQTPAAVRFVSYEPALGPVDFTEWLYRCDGDCLHPEQPHGEPILDWLIVGGESGPGARPFDAAWALAAVRDCKAAGVPVFVKQMGANVRDRNDVLATDRPATDPRDWPEPEEGWDDDPGGNIERLDDGYQGAPIRIRLKDRKGGDPAEWPADLRVRQFPWESK
jgi:protein gp37